MSGELVCRKHDAFCGARMKCRWKIACARPVRSAPERIDVHEQHPAGRLGTHDAKSERTRVGQGRACSLEQRGQPRAQHISQHRWPDLTAEGWGMMSRPVTISDENDPRYE